MSYKTALNCYIRKRNLHRSHLLQDCTLVIDGNSFFKESYKNSGCQFLLGPECDKYVIYLKKQLKCFSQCNITCYVIFKGTTSDDLEKRRKIHQQIIDERGDISNFQSSTSFFEPLLVEDMQKQTLQLCGIKYFCCGYESIGAIIGVARSLKCPVLTDNFEYCLYGVSCIPPNSITWDNKNKAVVCTLYDHDIYRFSIGVHNKMPILLTVLSMITELPECGNINDISSVIRWVKRQQKDVINDIVNNINDFSKRKLFLELFNRYTILYSYPSCNLAVKYFQREKSYGLYKDDKKWFSKGVSNGRIALPYVDMKRKGLVTGSTVINDTGVNDAIEAAAPIISYAHCLLTNSQNSKLKYIGRRNSICTTWDAEYYWKGQICNRDIFNKYGKIKKKPSLGNPFYAFIKELLSKEVADTMMFSVSLFSTEHKSCKILIITLVYYVKKVNKHFIDFAYYILLCYLILGPVREIVRTRKGISNDDIYKDCLDMYDKLKFLFHNDNLKPKYDSNIVHSLSEFLHCLQHMNYLNNLCLQNSDSMNIRGTCYYETYNATFVYNTFIFMKNKDELLSYLENNFNDSWGLRLYNKIVSKFNKYLQDADVQ